MDGAEAEGRSLTIFVRSRCFAGSKAGAFARLLLRSSKFLYNDVCKNL